MTAANLTPAVAELRQVLRGIDMTVGQAPYGWFDSPAMARFGRETLARVEALVARLESERDGTQGLLELALQFPGPDGVHAVRAPSDDTEGGEA